jgi:molybdenum cofactor biosynthesis enzyme MoaA
MTDPAQIKEDMAKAASKVACHYPWTTMEEANISGKFKACCWSDTSLGVLPKADPGDLMSLWNGQAMRRMRRALADGRMAEVCPADCVIPRAQAKLGYLDFYDYGPAEYEGFGNRFKDNRQAVMESMRGGKDRVETHPLRLKFHPSNLCNLACPMCLRHGHALQTETGPAYLENIFSQLPYLEELTVYGGEFLACPTTRRVVLGPEIRRHPQVHYTVTTNGTMLDKRNLGRLADLRFGKLIVSLDAASEPTYQAIRINARYAETMANLERLVRWRERGALRVRLLMAAFVIMAVNYQELTPFVQMCHDLGIHPFFMLVEESDELTPIADRVAESLDQAKALASGLGNRPALMQLELMSGRLRRWAAR